MVEVVVFGAIAVSKPLLPVVVLIIVVGVDESCAAVAD